MTIFKDWRKKHPEKKQKKPNLESSENFGITLPNIPCKLKFCDDKHKTGIKILEGTLYGYPGIYHSSHREALNIFLLDSWVSRGLYSKGLPADLYNKIRKYSKADLFFPIKDQMVPENLSAFDDLLDIAMTYLAKGSKVAVSCMGGHGRTGLVLAIIYGLIHPQELDPIAAIRLLGCSKWVESELQARFIFKKLNKPFIDTYKGKVFKFEFTEGLINAEQHYNPYMPYGNQDVWDF